MAQFARPDSDNSIGAWDDHLGSAVSMPSQLYSTIDETSASDSDYIFSENDPSTSACSFTLSNITDPTTSSGHIVRYRYRRLDTGGGSLPSIDLTIRLKQGATTIASQSHTGIATTYADGSFTLSGTEADNITDYTDLLIEFEADKSSGTRTSRAEVTWAEFETPDPGGDLRSTSQFAIPLVTNDPDLRVTSAGIFSLSDNDPDLRATSVGIFSLSDNDPSMRSTSQVASVLEVPPVWRYVPVSDVSTGSWTTGATDLYENLVLDDATYIDSSLNPTGGDSFEVQLRNFYWPETNYRLWVAMRISKVDSGGTQQEDGNQLDVLVEAINDATTIWQWNLTDIKQDQGYLILEAPVSSPLFVPITPTLFSLKATATSDGAGSNRKARISHFNLYSYDSFTATPVCLWWPCNCNPVNPTGCNECSIGLTGIPTNAAVTLSGITGSACCTGLNTTNNVTLTTPYSPDGTSEPAYDCWAGGTFVPAACSPSDNPRIEVYVNLVSGLVRVIVYDGAAPFIGSIWRSWTAQMTPTPTGWDCSLDHTDFVDDGYANGQATCGGTPSLDGFTLS